MNFVSRIINRISRLFTGSGATQTSSDSGNEYANKPSHNESLSFNEIEWIRRISNNLNDLTLREEYAGFLEQSGDIDRARIIKESISILRTDTNSSLSDISNFKNEWADSLGLTMLNTMSEVEIELSPKFVFSLAKPALRILESESNDDQIPVGRSKIGGLPDLPTDFIWPKGTDCVDYFSFKDDIDKYAGFLGQINFSEINNTIISSRIPSEGILSIFSYQLFDDDNVDTTGIKLYYFKNTENLKRTKPTVDLAEGNRVIQKVSTLSFEGTLDLPGLDNTICSELNIDREEYSYLDEAHREDNFNLLCGYFKLTTGVDDPTPDTPTENVLRISNSVGFTLTIQTPADQFINGDFDNSKLVWVDFD